ncbi:MAG TPA: hypothetical protein VF498_09455, partial [Anaerolineales bacterium]
EVRSNRHRTAGVRKSCGPVLRWPGSFWAKLLNRSLIFTLATVTAFGLFLMSFTYHPVHPIDPLTPADDLG